MRISRIAETTTVNIQLPTGIKEQAESVFAYHGLTLPEAIIVFINQTCQAGDIPFEIGEERWNDPESLAALEEIRLMEKNPNSFKRFKNAADLIADCLDGDDNDE